MKKKSFTARMISGLLSAVMVLQAAVTPITAFASEMNPEEELKAYVEALPELDQVKDQLDPEEVVTAKDYEVDFDTEIDLKNPKSNTKNAGFTPEEREKMSILLSSGFVDTFRFFFPDARDMYSWWSYRFQARERNVGWRIYYFIVAERLKPRLQSASIHNEIYGSDHCPVELVVDL
jgi:exodeoxyribonuclease III